MYCKLNESRLASPLPPQRFFHRAQKKVESGEYNFGVDSNYGTQSLRVRANGGLPDKATIAMASATTGSESNMSKELTAIIESEADGYVALCPELDVASQGDTVTEARSNLQEALELFVETAAKTEIEQRFGS